MNVKLILPALTEAKGKYWRPIKYSLFPPLGLATLAGYLRDDEVEIVDEHVEHLSLDDTPDLVGIEVYITSAYRAYEIADHYRRRGVHVVMGGLHPTALPHEALRHADTVILGPAEEAWPRFLADFRRGHPYRVYHSTRRTLTELPAVRRDLIQRRNYLVPNSIVVSRGCPHNCDFCYKHAFFKNGASYYHYALEQALAEIDSLPGRHLFFLDDNLFGDPVFAHQLFTELAGAGRIWQAAATVSALRDETLLDLAVQSGLRSLFIGFESLNQEALRRHNKKHNLITEYEDMIQRLQERGVMINASFVFGMDQDDRSVFKTTVDWAVKNSLETATFHILTPYPGTELFARYESGGRLLTKNWNLYDTRHAVFMHPHLKGAQLEEGYRGAYDQFYRWGSIVQSAHLAGAVAASGVYGCVEKMRGAVGPADPGAQAEFVDAAAGKSAQRPGQGAFSRRSRRSGRPQ